MTEVLIIGGGEFGLTTALCLARGKYKGNPEKILVIGQSNGHPLFPHDVVSLLLFFRLGQIDRLIRHQKMLLALISTRLFDLIMPILIMPDWLKKPWMNGLLIQCISPITFHPEVSCIPALLRTMCSSVSSTDLFVLLLK